MANAGLIYKKDDVDKTFICSNCEHVIANDKAVKMFVDGVIDTKHYDLGWCPWCGDLMLDVLDYYKYYEINI